MLRVSIENPFEDPQLLIELEKFQRKEHRVPFYQRDIEIFKHPFSVEDEVFYREFIFYSYISAVNTAGYNKGYTLFQTIFFQEGKSGKYIFMDDVKKQDNDSRERLDAIPMPSLDFQTLTNDADFEPRLARAFAKYLPMIET